MRGNVKTSIPCAIAAHDFTEWYEGHTVAQFVVKCRDGDSSERGPGGSPAGPARRVELPTQVQPDAEHRAARIHEYGRLTEIRAEEIVG